MKEGPSVSTDYRNVESATKHLTCSICGKRELDSIDELSGAQIKQLWAALGNKFSPEALGDLLDETAVILHKCKNCGFEFFDPSLAGGDRFYRELDCEGYYCPTRPEFARTLDFARRHQAKRILDVGCGSGAFLDMAKAAGHEVCGIELNRAAAQNARDKGHLVFEKLLGDLNPAQTNGGFDLITFFQVLEHVPDPMQVIRDANGLLNSGGFISVAVPSEEGVCKLVPYGPHQWPPHHVSRWRIADFEQIARNVGMKLVEKGGDILLGSEIEQSWNLHNRVAPVIGKREYFGGKLLPKMISLVYRKTGMKHVFPRWGISIFGYFQKH